MEQEISFGVEIGMEKGKLNNFGSGEIDVESLWSVQPDIKN